MINVSFLSNNCIKSCPTKTAYDKIKSTCNLIGPVDLYCLYLSDCSEPVDFKTFYNYAKQILFYDKYVCDHGVEYFYYVSFTDAYFEQHKHLINYYYNKCNKHMSDVIDVIPAVGDTHSVGLALDVAAKTRRK